MSRRRPSGSSRGGCGEKKKEKEKKRGKGRKEKGRDPKKKGLRCRWKDLFVKNRKQRRVAAKHRGWERKRARGRIRVLVARWAWAGLGYSLASQKHLFSFAN